MSKPVKIVIIGAGFGGTYTLKHLDKIYKNNKNVEITLVGEKNYFLFTPLLHEVATGGINPENIVESIHKVLGRCLSNFYLGKGDLVDLENKIVSVGEHKLPYDYLVLAPGAETNFYNIPGAEKHSMPLKSLECAVKIKNHIITQLEKASHAEDVNEKKKRLTFVVAGGGPTGVELAAELQEFLHDTFAHYYSKDVIENVSVVLIQKAPELMPQFGEKLRRRSLSILQKKKIDIRLNTGVKEVQESQIILDTGEVLPTETVIWVAGIKPRDIKFSTPVEKAPDGKIVVNEYLELKNNKGVFALGDVASVQNKEGKVLPALAQVAVVEAKKVAENIKLSIKGEELRPLNYKHTGNLVSLGQWMAIGEISRFTFSGRFTWWVWRTVYLSKLISFKKKLKVAIDWTVNLFLPRDISQF